MALAYLYDPLKQWQDLRGVNNVAGWLEVFISGTDEHAVAYSDFSGTLLPDRISIDNDGRAVVIVDSEKAYRVEVHDASGALRFTQYPVWTQQSGGGVIGSFVDIESSNGSLDVQKTVVGATTIYDISVSTDSTEGLDWIRTEGYTTNDGKLVPTYQEGPMEVGEHGIAMHGGRYYHVTARLAASVTAMPYYNEFSVTFSGMKEGGTSENYLTRNFVADCSTELSQQYEVSFDVMPAQDVELFASVSGLESGVSVGLLDIEVHRVYSGIPDIPDGMATKEWVLDELSGYMRSLVAGTGIELSGSMVSVDFSEVQGKLEAGTGIDITDDTVSVDFSEVQAKLEAGANIVIDGNTISATAEPQLNADWDASSGVQEILNKPDLSVYAEKSELAQVAFSGDYADLSGTPDLSVYATLTDLEGKQDTLTAGDNITITNNVISATAEPQVNADWDATSGVSEILNKPDLSVYATEAELADYQPVLTPGTGIDITGNTISVDTTTIATQSDLSTGLAGKQDTLTAGDNITITNNVISATVPEYADADWDAASGEPGYIHNKPDIGLFEATYGQTTYAEIMDAINARKIVFCPGQGSDSVNRMGTLTNYYTNPGSEYVEFEFYKSKTGTGVNDTVVIYRVDGNDNWTMDERDVKAGNISYPVTDVEVNGISVVSGGVASVTVPAQVQTDWDATSGVAQILNKPTEKSLVAGENITITDSGSTVTISATAEPQVNADWDATSGVAQILNKPDLSIYAESSSLSPVATSGSYNDLTDTPTIPEGLPPYNPGTDEGKVLTVGSSTPYWNTPAEQVNADWDATSGKAQILNKPDLSVYATQAELSGYQEVLSAQLPVAIANNSVGLFYGDGLKLDYRTSDHTLALMVDTSVVQDKLTAGDNITINGSTISATAEPQVNSDWDATSGVAQILNKPDLSIYAQSSSLSTVATTGDYDDLTNKPTIPAAQVNSDWDATSGVAEILNKPEQVSLVAGSNITITEGASTLTISSTSAPQVNADWDATSGVSQILNKPDLSIYAQSADLAAVATTGSYNSLTDTPTIPAAQVNSDWDATSGASEILNKPDLVDIVAGPGIVVDNPDGNTLRVSMIDTETVLYTGSDTTTVGTEFNLSEAYTNFEHIRIYAARSPAGGHAPYMAEYMVSSTYKRINYRYVGMNDNDTIQNLYAFAAELSGTKLTIKANSTKSLATAVTNSTSSPLVIVKISGVHRIANN